jgi:hypothetical protein
MAMKQYEEAFATLLHCASYGYQSGVRRGPFNRIGRFKELVNRRLRACSMGGFQDTLASRGAGRRRSFDDLKWVAPVTFNVVGKSGVRFCAVVEIGLNSCLLPLAERSAESTWHLPSQS